MKEQATPPEGRPGSPDGEEPFSNTWWGSAFVALVETYRPASRVAQGRRMARAGDVLSLEIEGSGIRARVRVPPRASEDPLVDVAIGLRHLNDRAFDRVLERMASKASFVASLLAGRLPEDIEDAFEGGPLGLLPKATDEIANSCSCGDDAPCCRHAAAVHYALAARLDADPFLLFQLRGMDRETLLESLRRRRLERPEGARGPSAEGAAAKRDLPVDVLPDVRPETFFKPRAPIPTLRVPLTPGDLPEGVFARLDPPPFRDPEASRLLEDLHHSIGLGAKERLSEWEWRRVRGRTRPG